jgi:hypothetical protein
MRIISALLLLITTSCASSSKAISPALRGAPALEASYTEVESNPVAGEVQESLYRSHTSSAPQTYEQYRQKSQALQEWRPGQPVLQGYIGAARLDQVELSGGSSSVDGRSSGVNQYPVIGGGAQWKVAGKRLDFGIEGMIGFGWRSGGSAFVSDGGGLTVAVKVDLLMIDLYGGPFLSIPLGDRARVYGGAGPVITFADYNQKSEETIESESGSGFGTGVYGRFGFEFAVWTGAFVGLGARWQDSTISLSGGAGDLEAQGWQYFLSVTQGF